MFSARVLGLGALVSLVALAGGTAAAQQVYRIVGPDGKVTFSDRPPPDARSAPAPAAAPAANPGSGGGAQLPFELRNLTSRYPVTLYAGNDCAPCDAGRRFLTNRGIPFSERTVTSDADIEALMRLSGDQRLPVLTIGGQQLKGFSEMEWTRYLDAAGYPKTSQLPAGYRNPAPTPLVAVQPAPRTPVDQAPAPEQAAAPDAPALPPVDEPPPNPAGIRF